MQQDQDQNQGAEAPPLTPTELMIHALEAQERLDQARKQLSETPEAKAVSLAATALDEATNKLLAAIPKGDTVGITLGGYEAKWATRTTTSYDPSEVATVIRTLLPEDEADKIIALATKTVVGVEDLRSAAQQAVATGVAPADLMDRIVATGKPNVTESFVFKPLPKSRGGKGKGA